MDVNELLELQHKYPHEELRPVFREARHAIATRVKVSERWEIIDSKGVEYVGGFASKDEAERFQAAVGVLLEDARIVHVTRYRRAK